MHPPDPTRPGLLSSLAGSDDSAWVEFEDQYRDLILSYAKRRGLQESDAQDVLQVVLGSLVLLFRSGFQHDPSRGRFRSYLGRVAQNAVTRITEDRSRDHERLSTEVAGRTRDQRDGADQAWDEEWEAFHLRRALATVRRQLEPKSLEVFESFLAGGSVDEVARRHGITSDAAYKIRSRVRERVESEVARQVEVEDAR